MNKEQEEKTITFPPPPDEKTLKERLKFIESIEDIPPMPGVVMNLLAKLEEPRVKYREVEKLISTDPALVSYLLRVTNSPLLGLRSKVINITKAVSVLGIANLKSLLIAYGVRFLYKSIKNTDVQRYLWEHSVRVGVFARVISEKVYSVVHSQVYVFGLLHDIGKIILLMLDGDKFNETLDLGVEKEIDGVEVEAKFFGFSHIEAGYFLMSKLGFPQEMKDIIMFHHNPEFCAKDNQLPWIVSFANRLSYQMENFEDEGLQWYLQKLNLSLNQLESIVIEGQEQLQQYLSIY